MTNPTVRIPKPLIPLVDQTAKERGVAPSVIVGQAIRFYLSATDPALIAMAVVEAIKPLAADIRHMKYLLDKQAADPKSTPTNSPIRSEKSETDRHAVIQEVIDTRQKIEQRRQAAIDRMKHKTSSPTTTNTGTNR
jgi:hypothetical protein